MNYTGLLYVPHFWIPDTYIDIYQNTTPSVIYTVEEFVSNIELTTLS